MFEFKYKIGERVCGSIDGLRMEGTVLKQDAGISRDAIIVILDNGDTAVMLEGTVCRVV